VTATYLDATAATEFVLAAAETGEAVVVLVLMPPSAEAGGRIVIRRAPDGTLTRVGGSGDDALDSALRDLARKAMEGAKDAQEGLHSLGTDDGTEVRFFLEVHRHQPELLIVGAGHIAQPLCSVGALLGFRVRVLDDRPEFATCERFPEAEEVVRIDMGDPFGQVPLAPETHVVLVTRGHKYDYACLRQLLSRDEEVQYIGMIGSRRRVRAAFTELVEEGFERERIAKIRAPVGLDLRAETPAEIAVAVAAEIVLLWRGGSAQPLADQERIVPRFFKAGQAVKLDDTD
jgi:xanthine dehydrogenase accessory factor